MLTIKSSVFVAGITGRQITDFLLNCTDGSYRRWWPGTHLQLHVLAHGGSDHVGDVVFMDEYLGTRRVQMTGSWCRPSRARSSCGSSSRASGCRCGSPWS